MNARNVFSRRRFKRKVLVSDPGMHHGTCVTHVPWCLSGSLTCGDGGNVPAIPGAWASAILRIWQEAHGVSWLTSVVFVRIKHNWWKQIKFYMTLDGLVMMCLLVANINEWHKDTALSCLAGAIRRPASCIVWSRLAMSSVAQIKRPPHLHMVVYNSDCNCFAQRPWGLSCVQNVKWILIFMGKV